MSLRTLAFLFSTIIALSAFAPSAHAPAPPASATCAPAIVPRAVWDPTFNVDEAHARGMNERPGDLRRFFTHLVVHHSDFDPPIGPGGLVDYNRTVSGFADIGYHFVVAADGRVYEGRDLRYVGAHAGATREQAHGRVEHDPDWKTIGVVVDGYFMDDAPSDAQRRALFALLDDLRARFSIDTANVITHRDVRHVLVEERRLTPASPATVCPGDALFHVVDEYRAVTKGTAQLHQPNALHVAALE